MYINCLDFLYIFCILIEHLGENLVPVDDVSCDLEENVDFDFGEHYDIDFNKLNYQHYFT